jgi:hypothetical protein
MREDDCFQCKNFIHRGFAVALFSFKQPCAKTPLGHNAKTPLGHSLTAKNPEGTQTAHFFSDQSIK